jgi:hypothetical protein
MSDFSFSTLQKVAKDAGFTVIADGEYEVKIIKSEAKDTSTGKKMIKVLFKVIAGPLAGNGTVWNQFVISPESPNALFFFFKHMKALGLDDDYFAGNPKPEQVAKDLLNRRCKIKVGTRQWNGNDQNDVQAVFPPDMSVAEQVAAGTNGGNTTANPGVPDMSAVKPTTNGDNGNGDKPKKEEVKEPVSVASTTTEMPPPPF